MPWNIRERCQSYTEMWEPLYYGIWAIYDSAKTAFRNGQYRTLLFSPSALRDAGFHRWYSVLNEHFLAYETRATPVPSLIPHCRGVVLELGPGPGNQLPRFDHSQITRIIGVEPNAHFAPDIHRQVRAQGLEGVYELVTARIEDVVGEGGELARRGVREGSVDTVLSIQVLCSVWDQRETVREMWRLLKPGGRFVFWEHVGSGDVVTRGVQHLWNPLWKFFGGGCSLSRDTMAAIAAAGEWENLESISGDGGEEPWGMMPRVWGVLVKPG